MKKILNYLIALALVLIPFIPVANAATITINNSVVGQEYKAYKIFDVTKSGEGENATYAYSIDSTSEWFSVVQNYATNNADTFTLTQVGSTTKYVVIPGTKFATDENAKAFADYLNSNTTGKTATASANATSSTTVLNGLAAGYYFVDSSLGALCILHTAADSMEVTEKNGVPTVDKAVSVPSASVGETVTFTISITAGGKADTSYILHDKMTAGLTLNASSFAVKVGDTAVDSNNYTVKTTGLADSDCTFEIVFNQAYTATLERNTVIVVTYTATVNENAIINSEDSNEAKVQYGNTYSPSKKVTVYNYDFDLVKVTTINNEKITLSGAQFKLYNALTGGNEIKLIKITNDDGTSFYRPVQTGETAAPYIEAGSVSIKGLAQGTYYLEETKAPDGYNQLTSRVAVTLNGDLTGEKAIKVENTTGNMLPSTGGMGTVLFITIGSIMVLGFGVLLVTKLRLSKMYI